MARQNIGIGSVADDGTGDTLRTAGTKINQNFQELYGRFGDSTAISNKITIDSFGVIFEGNSVDSFETILSLVEPTADRNVYLPDANGTIITDSATQTLVNKTLNVATLGSPQISDSQGQLFKFVAGNLASDINVNLPVLTDSDTLVFQAHTQTLTNKTLNTPTIATPKITTSINDAAGAELIVLDNTASAVNEITVKNNIANNFPLVSASGNDTDINLQMAGKGTGSVEIAKAAYSVSTQTSAGTVSNAHSYIIFNNATPFTATLADGTTVGEIKIFTNKGAGAITVQPSNYAQGSFFQLAQYDGCQAVWDGTNWYVVGNQGELTVA